MSRAAWLAPLLALWELPQNLLGLVTLGLLWVTGDVVAVERRRARLFVECHRMGVSLGWFVFWTRESTAVFEHDLRTREHEFGHSIQSRWFGPAYLLIVGVPSVSRVLYALHFARRHGRPWQGYYDGWPENHADRLGKVRRAVRRERLTTP